MEKHSSVLEDELMEDAPGQSVSAGSTLAVTARKVNASVWLQRAYEKINNDLRSIIIIIIIIFHETHAANRLWRGYIHFGIETLYCPFVSPVSYQTFC